MPFPPCWRYSLRGPCCQHHVSRPEPARCLRIARVALPWPSGGGAWRSACLAGRACPRESGGQAARCRMAATARQPLHPSISGPGLFARIPASSLSRGRTSTPSFFLGLRANSSRRGPCGDIEQALGPMFKQLLARKTEFGADAAHGIALQRTLGPWGLTALGIGAVIGGGIFVITGQAAAEHAGPAIVLSFIIAAICCSFTALCYAEFATLIPMSGSSYSYAYATLGELVAWFIGW